VAAAPRAPRAAPRPSVQAPPDVPALQTAAALANTLGSFWRSALALPFVGGPAALPAVASLAARCGQLAGDHADALNAAATARGGAAQTATDPTYQVTVDKALPTLSDAGLAVGVAITLTDLALQTVTALVSEVDAGDARQLLASVGCVLGAQRAHLLLARRLLADDRTTQLGDAGPDLTALEASVGDVGEPELYTRTSDAVAATEGAVP